MLETDLPTTTPHASRRHRMRARRRTAAIAVATLVAAGCGPGAERSAIDFQVDPTAFPETPLPASRSFDLVAADMDLDRDADLLVNWHNTGRLELFENVEGSFRLVNPADDDRSGLYENRGIDDLYAASDAMVERIRVSGAPGVYLWHGTNPRDTWDTSLRDGWNLYVVPAGEPIRLRVETNCPLELDLEERFLRSRSESAAEVEVDAPVHFRTLLDYISTQCKVSTTAPLFVGASLRPVPGGKADLLKDDSHGMAWVDVRGTAQPDLFLTRGGLRGALQPPYDPKTDLLFEYDGGTPLYTDLRETLPSGYGRGRRVEWVDIDGDLQAELYVGNNDTPNVLLGSTADGSYRDLASELALDFQHGNTFAWLDVDGNGLDDLVFLDEGGFEVAFNRGERRFEVRPGREVGLVFPAASTVENPELFDMLSLHVLDQDDDGRLDLWLVGHGAAPERSTPSGRPLAQTGAHALYRAGERGFSDVTAEVGLDEAPPVRCLVLLDADNDGYCDALSIGPSSPLLHNEGGARFVPVEFPVGQRLRLQARGAALDADGDGRLDLALMDGGRFLARNACSEAGGALFVVPRADGGDPVGTLVTAVYRDGRRQAQRYGSMSSSQYSQGLLPLHFGIPVESGGGAIERLEVRWPDGREETRTVQEGETRIELRHPVLETAPR